MKINNPKTFFGFSYNEQSNEGNVITQKELSILENSLKGYINGLLFGGEILPVGKKYGFAWLDQNGKIPVSLLPAVAITNCYTIYTSELGFKYNEENEILEISQWSDNVSIEEQVNEALRIYFLKQYFDLVPVTENDDTNYTLMFKSDILQAKMWSKGDMIIVKKSTSSELNDQRVIGTWIIISNPNNIEMLISTNNKTFSDWCEAVNEFNFINISYHGE